MKKFFILLMLLLVVISLAKVKIQFWHAMGGWRIELLQNMAEDFMKIHPDIEVEVQYTGSYRDTLNKLVAAVQGGTPPHVVQIYEIGTQFMIDSGIAVPIGDLIEKDPSFDIGKFLPQVLDYYRVKGKLYSMPFNSSNPILYYNKTLFKEAGLDPNNPPRTFDELIEYCRKLTVKDEKGNIVRAGITWPLHSWFFEQFIALQNAPLVDNENGRAGRPTKAVFNHEAALRFLRLWNTLTKEGLMINTTKEDWTGARQLFISQKVAMLITSTSDVKLMMDASKENGFELGTAFLPKPEGVKLGGTPIGGGSLWIIGDHPEEEIKAAWEFVKWMAEPEQQIRWHLGTGYFPVRKDAVETLLYQGYYGEYPHHLTALLQLLLSVQTPNTRGAVIGPFPEVRDIIETAIEKMINEEMTPEEALAWAEKEATRAIKEYNELYE
ncbi:ABC transporter substrate-binding protein [Thermotoga sp. 38H-to]|uniref:ABC transporter substrate-binding protein n=1 Tax=Thermotoga sp. 38H-to TaxID=1755812 RepID=UPI0013EDCEDE|nr:ABC transporter substrate-binding protein [Thermotoga sp. 38H-to]KAF2960130.1 glycerol-3-phosphate ABC transporter substrate-binding protein [Thermotoga sp. 38H-to]